MDGARAPETGVQGGGRRLQGEAWESGSAVARLRPDPRLWGGGVPGRAAFPDLAGRALGARDMKRYPRRVRRNAPGPPGGACAPLAPTGGLGVRRGWRPEAKGQRSHRGERCGPGTCGKEEWLPDCAAGHPLDLVVLGWKDGSEAVEKARGTLVEQLRKRLHCYFLGGNGAVLCIALRYLGPLKSCC